MTKVGVGADPGHLHSAVRRPSLCGVERPDPCEYQPPLRWWSHAWRLAVMLLISAIGWVPSLAIQADTSHLWIAGDAVLGVVAYVLVFLRRRWPVPIAVTLGLISSVSGAASGPAVLA